MLEVEIDHKAGHCFGVEYAIRMAEDGLDEGTLYCLGDIVHNGMEVKRLAEKGLIVIDREQLKELKDCKVLIRAHGEPPETYKIAIQNNIELIDASCPVVMKLQNRVRESHQILKQKDGQLVIYGKKGHAEVIGLQGQTNNEAIVVTEFEDLDQLDFSKPIILFSQTTKPLKAFYAMREEMQRRAKEAQGELMDFEGRDSICRQVSNRAPQLEEFSKAKDVIVFVSGKKSSNGKSLHGVCKKINERSYIVENETEIDLNWFNKGESVGVSGATSTPMWLMEQVANHLRNIKL